MSDAEPQIPPAPVLPPRHRPGLVGRRFAVDELPADWTSPRPRRSATSPSEWEAPTPASPPSASQPAAAQALVASDADASVARRARRGRWSGALVLLVAVGAVLAWYFTQR